MKGKEIIPKDTRYVPFTQQSSCCVPTCVSIVMYKLGIPLLPSELLGYHMGLIVSKEDKHLFWNARTGKKPGPGYGTRLGEKRYDLSSVFKKLKIPIIVTEYPIQDFKNKKDIVDFIYSRISKNKDIIVFLRSGVLNNNNKINGHACVIDRIYPNKNLVRLIDPSAKRAKWREFTIDKLIKAVKLHPTNKGRFIELQKNK